MGEKYIKFIVTFYFTFVLGEGTPQNNLSLTAKYNECVKYVSGVPLKDTRLNNFSKFQWHG